MSSEAKENAYKEYVINVSKMSSTMDSIDGQLSQINLTNHAILTELSNNLEFAQLIEGMRGELEATVMNYLSREGYHMMYSVEEHNIWFFGWLLMCSENINTWLIRPKDMISDSSRLKSLNKTDFIIMNDYLSDLLNEVVKRTINKDIDNKRFGFQIFRSLVFNVTDVKNVTNCTNKELYCPCAEGKISTPEAYCDNSTSTPAWIPEWARKQSPPFKRRVLASNETNDSSDPSDPTNTSNSTQIDPSKDNTSNTSSKDSPSVSQNLTNSSSSANTSGNSTTNQTSPQNNSSTNSTTNSTNHTDEFEDKPKPAANSTSKSPYDKPPVVENRTGFNGDIMMLMSMWVMTPQTALSSLAKNYKTEPDLRAFAMVLPNVLRQYLYKELLGGYDLKPLA